ncbi:HAD family hydrolase [Jannaschia seohaensis]|uniref:phosphoglycolate phosphatase n=1 Tax=Jannaschia seohaensis TaxID=475081 RepID=A0A2Y9C764_9RHOB|nr:HAD-IA family hydrolase [Jannaschia seohaensis]PWJ20423.1 phosphoglycolate phosphatase [Jannaschia seohaensis]SSA44503.1 phosphoglycolate phosphatase [Jannaschia seohaensis]
MTPPPIRAVLFDKDGTFTDFRATWETWMVSAIRELADETGGDADHYAGIVGIDLASGRIRPDGRFVTATNAETAAHLSDALGWPLPRVEAWWRARVHHVAQVVVTPLDPYLAGLRARGLALGVLTNADAAEARKHLGELGALPHLDRVIACDDGYGAKPDPGGALAFAEGLGLSPREIVLVGDGMTDLRAAAGAGMRAVAVTTGTLDRAALAPHAETVLDDIRALPAWLDAQTQAA